MIVNAADRGDHRPAPAAGHPGDSLSGGEGAVSEGETRLSSSTLYRPLPFLADVCATVHQARDRIWMQTMMFTAGHAAGVLAHALGGAAARGLDTRLVVDHYTFLVQGALPAWVPALRAEERAYHAFLQAQTRAMYRALTDAGVRLTYTNPPRTLGRLIPYRGRNHIKVALVDNAAYIGGLNIEDALFGQADFMVKMSRAAVVRAVADHFGRVAVGSSPVDEARSCDSENRLLWDGGTPGRSLIVEEAVRAIRAGTRQITLVAMYPPGGPVLDTIIARAREGSSVTIIMSPRDDRFSAHYPVKWAYDRFRARVAAHPTITVVHAAETIHAKALLLDQRQVFIGSHNLTPMSVLLGTQEMTLHTRDPEIVAQVRAFSDALVRSP